ncbi:RNA cap guanine-N2 methyltransferase [Tanacetum coccineum]
MATTSSFREQRVLMWKLLTELSIHEKQQRIEGPLQAGQMVRRLQARNDKREVLLVSLPVTCFLTYTVNNGSNDDYGDWMTRWDEFYERNYYYNRRIQESTWEPPPIMENLAFGGYVSHESKEDSNSVYGKMDSNEENSNLLQHVAVSDGLSSAVSPVKIHNEHLVEPELTADRVDSVLTSSIVGYSDL